MVARETSLRYSLESLGLQPSDRQLDVLGGLEEILATEAIEKGLIGPNELPRIRTRHILESAALAALLDGDGAGADIGSGAGLPGLVLAALGVRMTLIESLARRADFLRSTSARLGLKVDVVHARAEDLAHGGLREKMAVVTSRALAPVRVALELCVPFARVGGRVLIVASPVGTKGGGVGTDTAEEGPAEADQALSRACEVLGAGPPSWEELMVPGGDRRRWVMMLEKLEPTPPRYPRRAGVPARRPLGGGVASVE